MVLGLIIGFVVGFTLGALVFRNNAKKANEIIDVIKTK